MKDQTFAKRVCVLVAGLCAGLLAVESAWAVTVTNNGTTIFRDDFETDTVGSQAMIGAGDIGTSWHQFYREVTGLEFTTDIEDDSTSQAGLTDSRDGRYVSLEHNAAVGPEIFSQFPDQTSGTLKADFAAYLPQNGSSGYAVRVAYTQGIPLLNADEGCCEVSHRHTAYLLTGNWTSNPNFPAGINDDDVLVAYWTGSASSYRPMHVAGGDPNDPNDILAAVCVGCADEWIDVSLEQSPTDGSEPVYTLNGVTLAPVPRGNVGPPTNPGDYTINGLQFGTNGNLGASAYIDFLDPNDGDGCFGDCAGSPGAPTTYTWTGNTIGDWLAVGNWTPQGLPNKNDHTAILGSNIGVPATVVTNSDITVRTIRFDSPVGYAVAGQGSILLESQSVEVAAGVEVLQAATSGAHEFQARVQLGSDATVNVAGGATLNFTNVLNLRGGVLTKTGDGTVLISNSLILGGGTVLMAEGTLAGSGTIGSDVDNAGGTISPGNSASVAGQAVPEPGALGLLLLAGVACFLWRWNQAARPN